jgi:hypothetical protein
VTTAQAPLPGEGPLECGFELVERGLTLDELSDERLRFIEQAHRSIVNLDAGDSKPRGSLS